MHYGAGGGVNLDESIKGCWQTDWNQEHPLSFYGTCMELPSNRFVRRGAPLLLILNKIINLKRSKSPDYIV